MKTARKFPSGPRLTALQMVEGVHRATADWEFDRISIGYPGPVIHDKLALEPRNLAPGWVDFDFTAAFGKPVKLINDAAMQALGSYEGGRMLFLGLGTGLGSALIIDGVIAPELAHLPYRKRVSSNTTLACADGFGWQEEVDVGGGRSNLVLASSHGGRQRGGRRRQRQEAETPAYRSPARRQHQRFPGRVPVVGPDSPRSFGSCRALTGNLRFVTSCEAWR